jgi:hypothetical protein
MNIPSNIIVSNQYTSGKEFIYSTSYEEYIGYYYTLNNRYFVGKTFNTNSPELIKRNSDKINTFLTQPSTYVYGLISKTKLNKTKVNSIDFSPTDKDFEQGFQIRYFIKKLNVTPFFIKEVKKEDFEKLRFDSLYQVIQIEYRFDSTENDLNNLNKKMPGLKEYLSTDTLPTSSEEDGL